MDRQRELYDWTEYLFGPGQHERLKEFGRSSGLDFLRDGVHSLSEAIGSGADPITLAEAYTGKGLAWKQLFAEYSYLWLTRSTSASKALDTHTWPIVATFIRESLPTGSPTEQALCIADYGCGPGVQLERIARVAAQEAPGRPAIILQEDDDALAVFAAAVRALEISREYPTITVMTCYNDIQREHPLGKKYPPPQIGLALASTLPYLTLEEQKVFLKRMADAGTSKLLLSGQVNGFDPYRYFLTGYERKPFSGLRAEWQFIAGGRFPRRPALRYAMTASEMAKRLGPVYPALQQAFEMYRDQGWTPNIEKVWIPANGKIRDMSQAKGVIVTLRRQ